MSTPLRRAPWLLAVLALSGCDEGWRTTGALELDRGALVEGAGHLSDAQIDALVATQVERVVSRTSAERAVRRLDLQHHATFMGVVGADQRGWAGGDENAAVERALDLVSAARRGDTLFIDVEARHDDPQLAATLCNAIMEAAIDVELERATRERIAADPDAAREPPRGPLRVAERCRVPVSR